MAAPAGAPSTSARRSSPWPARSRAACSELARCCSEYMPKARWLRSSWAAKSSSRPMGRISTSVTSSYPTAQASIKRSGVLSDRMWSEVHPIFSGIRKYPSGELLHNVVAHVVVREDVLDVIGVFQRVDHLEYLAGLVLVEVDLAARQERGVGGLVVDPGLLQRGAHRDQVGRLGDDLEGLAEVGDLLGAGVEDRHEDVVLGQVLRLLDDDDALAVEPVRHRARVRGAVAVVGQALHEHRHAAGAVALVGDVLVLRAAGLLAGAALDR